jgi:hypothetical protein
VQRVRRRVDGQLGFVVESEGGQKYVRLDRGNKTNSDHSLIPYRETDWAEDREPKPNQHQIARLCYALDREWRMTLGGEYGVPEWRNLRDEARAAGFRLPENAHPARRRLYEAVRKALAE